MSISASFADSSFSGPSPKGDDNSSRPSQSNIRRGPLFTFGIRWSLTREVTVL